MPKYTFLLPAYKSQFLREALESIKHQEYHDFQVLVSDDCSPENLKEIFDETVGTDSRFLYRRNQENIGGKSLVTHWNLLVDSCDTEFFIMASDDDVYASNYLTEIDKLTTNYPTCNLFRGRARYIDSEGKLMVNDALWPDFSNNMRFILMAMADMTISCEANTCYRTKAFKDKGGYQIFPAAWFTDDATHIKMASDGCASTSDIVFGFRSSTVNISAQHKNRKINIDKAQAALLFWDWITNYLKEMECMSEPYLKIWTIRECRKAVLSQFDQYIKLCPWNDFIKLTRTASRSLGLSRFAYTFYWMRYRLKGV